MIIEEKFEKFRELYLQDLGRQVSYDGGKTFKQKSSKIQDWKQLPVTKPELDLSLANDVWIWSDLHFGHNNIIRFSDRPFPDVQTMNEHLVLNFNDYVKPDDVSLWVGDVSFQSDNDANRILRRCNGYKILIVGNHDFYKHKLKKLAFDEIHIVYPIETDDVSMILSHYPMDDLPSPWINIHGHEHVSKHSSKNKVTQINVNCEFHNYKPLNFKEVIGWAKARRDSAEAKDWTLPPLE